MNAGMFGTFSRRTALAALMVAVMASAAAAQTTAPNTAPSTSTKPANFTVQRDIAYKSGDTLSDYEKERCKMDVYTPKQRSASLLPILVWFHGGGLEGGEKSGGSALGESWAQQGYMVVIPNYRLSPKATYPAYLDDAAASVAWTIQHAAEFGGDPKQVFVTGHSAGGYLCAQIAYEPKYLAAYNVKTTDLAGVIPISGQVFTHSTIRKERGVKDPWVTPVIDTDAPVYHVQKDLPPTLLIIGDNDWPARLEEYQYLMAIARHTGMKDMTMKVIAERNHSTIIDKMRSPTDPGWQAMVQFMAQHAKQN